MQLLEECSGLQMVKRLEHSGRVERKQTEVAKIALQVVVLLHLDPPLAHTVHIEPLTPADWESERLLGLL